MFVRQLTPAEKHALKQALRSRESFTLRRAQVLIQSEQGRTPQQIASSLGCSAQSVRNALHAFHERGLESLQPLSRRPKTIRAAFDEAGHERLLEVVPFQWIISSLEGRALPDASFRSSPGTDIRAPSDDDADCTSLR